MWNLKLKAVDSYNVIRFNFKTIDELTSFVAAAQEHSEEALQFEILFKDEESEEEENEVIRD